MGGKHTHSTRKVSFVTRRAPKGSASHKGEIPIPGWAAWLRCCFLLLARVAIARRQRAAASLRAAAGRGPGKIHASEKSALLLGP